MFFSSPNKWSESVSMLLPLMMLCLHAIDNMFYTLLHCRKHVTVSDIVRIWHFSTTWPVLALYLIHCQPVPAPIEKTRNQLSCY